MPVKPGSAVIFPDLTVSSNSWLTIASNQVSQLIVSNATIQAAGGIALDALASTGPGTGGASIIRLMVILAAVAVTVVTAE